MQLAGLQAGIAPGVSQRLAPASGEQMQQIGGEGVHRPTRQQTLVNRAALVVAVGAAEQQPVAVLGVLGRGTERTAEQQVAQGNAPQLDPGGRRSQKRFDLRPQRSADPLVGIDLDHPVAARILESDVALCGKAQPWLLHHTRPRGPRDLHGLIDRARVDHDDLVAEGNAGQACGQTLGLVAGDDAGGDARPGASR